MTLNNTMRCTTLQTRSHPKCIRCRSDTVAIKKKRCPCTSTASSFLPVFPGAGPRSQHGGNLILDLRDQDVGQHDACNLEDSSSHFRSRNTLWLYTLQSASRSCVRILKNETWMDCVTCTHCKVILTEWTRSFMAVWFGIVKSRCFRPEIELHNQMSRTSKPNCNTSAIVLTGLMGNSHASLLAESPGTQSDRYESKKH